MFLFGQGDVFNPLCSKESSSPSDFIQRTQYPMITGSSILGLKFNNGVIIAADTQCCFDTMRIYDDFQRVIKINDQVIVAAAGDIADVQYLQERIKEKVTEDECIDDGFSMKPKALYNYLIRLLYSRRSKFDPLWVNFVIAGFQDGKPFLGTVDKLGTAYEDGQIGTGFGAYLGVPLMRAAAEKAEAAGGLTEEQALQVMRKSIEILYYRDKKASSKYHIGIVRPDGVEISEPLVVDSNWDVASLITGYE